MKVAVLAGGAGRRLSGGRVPKPLTPIGGVPILWHILRYYAAFGLVPRFREKPRGQDWVSGGIFVVEREVLAKLGSAACDWDRDIMPALAAEGQLAAYRHGGFWQCLDTPQDHDALEALWRGGSPPWAIHQER